MYRREKKGVKPWWVIIFLLLAASCWFLASSIFGKFTVNAEVTVRSGDTFGVFYSGLSNLQVTRIKRHIKQNDIDTSRLEVGNYAFSGKYTPASFVSHILDGSEKNFTRLTILEGWSIYDIDDYLTQEWFISPWWYISYVTQTVTIQSLQQQYDFLREAWSIRSLEGFLYPDTYFLDQDADVVPALVRVQLDTFDKRVRQTIQDDLSSFYRRLAQDFPAVDMDWYDIMTLASVVQKEERIAANQPTIAGIFLRRMQLGMRIDADITLCYGLKQPYSVCTPNYIARYVSDRSNVYNTRQRMWLPPSVIANIPVSAIDSVLWYKTSDYLYYLHDPRGRIHYGSSLEEHNRNKQQYLR